MTNNPDGAQVQIRTERFLIEGTVHVGGNSPTYKRRLSDVLNDHPPFLVLTRAILREPDRSMEPERHQTFILRKAEIIYALPLD